MANLKSLQASAPSACFYTVVGDIVEISQDGIALVDFPQNAHGAVVAKSTLSVKDEERVLSLPAKVTLVFQDGDLNFPIITGVISDTLFSATDNADEALSEGVENKSSTTNVMVDGKQITFDAKNEILLRCGKSSIRLSRDGKIVIKGDRVLSRASGANKIKGSSVNIN